MSMAHSQLHSLLLVAAAPALRSAAHSEAKQSTQTHTLKFHIFCFKHFCLYIFMNPFLKQIVFNYNFGAVNHNVLVVHQSFFNGRFIYKTDWHTIFYHCDVNFKETISQQFDLNQKNFFSHLPLVSVFKKYFLILLCVHLHFFNKLRFESHLLIFCCHKIELK